jgi:hypothetical protein
LISTLINGDRFADFNLSWRADPSWTIEGFVENFGTVPCKDVILQLKILIDGQQVPFLDNSPPFVARAESFPGAPTLSTSAQISITNELRDAIWNRKKPFVARMVIEYWDSSRKFTHTADAQYDIATSSFAIIRSETSVMTAP